jgi:hypothetical protein
MGIHTPMGEALSSIAFCAQLAEDCREADNAWKKPWRRVAGVAWQSLADLALYQATGDDGPVLRAWAELENRSKELRPVLPPRYMVTTPHREASTPTGEGIGAKVGWWQVAHTMLNTILPRIRTK